ncbi:hypothetical protein J1N35_007459 [Gossypium stocksii]|uniref:Uncharacterized protein n=1 Tax=Gossypium stocksii TaxID=47602 RepID=A0A9D3W6Q8_9ROSI|nr:hypothetical protein J1N35_007459 [Gossypium stocksii]
MSILINILRKYWSLTWRNPLIWPKLNIFPKSKSQPISASPDLTICCIPVDLTICCVAVALLCRNQWGKKILEDVNNPVGPFGTKEAPAVVKSYYNKRIVGCPGTEGGMFNPPRCSPRRSCWHVLEGWSSSKDDTRARIPFEDASDNPV